MENQHQEKEQYSLSILSLFDTLWFYHPILFHNPPPPPPPPAPETIPIKVVERIPNSRISHRRSLSDEQLLHIPNSSSTSTNSHAKLQTIVSGKESVLQENTSIEIKNKGMSNKSKRRSYRRRGSSSSSTKSLSDLEFEELKGFMDLGFTFSDAETDPRLMSIVPGLRRRVACDDENFENERHGFDDDDEEGGGGVVRPYLSEVWEEEEEERRLRNWRIPAPVEGVDMKDCLRLWAQAVASTVR